MSHLTRSLYAHNATLNNNTNFLRLQTADLNFLVLTRSRELTAQYLWQTADQFSISRRNQINIRVQITCDGWCTAPSHGPQRHWLVTESMPPAASHWLEHKSGGGQGCRVHGVRVTAEREEVSQQGFFPSWKRFLFSAWERQSNTISYKNWISTGFNRQQQQHRVKKKIYIFNAW